MLETIHFLNQVFHNKIPLFILINFVLLIILIYLNWSWIKLTLSEINRKTWAILGIIFIIALLLRLFLPPHQHLIYFDEFVYMEAGKSMILTGQQGAYPKSIGWPFILSIAFVLFGISNWVALYSSSILGALTVINVFLLTYSMLKNKNISLISVAVFSLMPIHIRWSANAETNVVSLYFVTLIMFFCFLYYKYKKCSLLWLSLIGLAFVAQFRPENYIFPVLFVIGIVIFNKQAIKKINFRFMIPFFAWFVLSSANLWQILEHYLPVNWIESDSLGMLTGSNWSFNNLIYNTLHFNIFNPDYLFAWLNFLILIVTTISLLILIVGSVYMLKIKTKEAIFLVAWWIILYLIYFSSWLQTVAARRRMYMSFYPITVIFFAYGISLFYKKYRKFTLSIGGIIVIFLFTPLLLVLSGTCSDIAHKLETKIPELAEKDLPADCIIICNCPSVLTATTNLHAIRISEFLSCPDSTRKSLINYGKILFFEDYCSVDWQKPEFQNNYQELKKRYSLKLYKTYQEKWKKYHFYTIKEELTKNKK